MKNKLWKQHWLLYDGDCPMCRRCVSWLLRHDPQNQFAPAPSQTAPALPDGPMNETLRRACEGAVYIVTREGQIYRGAAAVLFALGAICPPLRRFTRGLMAPPWVWPLNAVYKWIAENRPRIGRFVLPNEPYLVPKEWGGKAER